MIDKARYVEELDLLTKPLSNKSISLTNKIESLSNKYDKTKEEWIFEVLGISFGNRTPQSAYVLAKERGYTGTKETWLNLLFTNPKNAYLKMYANGYNSDYKTWINDFVYDYYLGTDSTYELAKANGFEGSFEKWLIQISGFEMYGPMSAYDFVCQNGYKGTSLDWFSVLASRDGYLLDALAKAGYMCSYKTEYEEPVNNDYELFVALYNDQGNGKILSAYEAAKVVNQTLIDELQAQKNEIDSLIQRGKDRELPNWSNYFSRYQKAFENEDYEFWMNYALTTFKVVEKKTGNVWFSNPEKPDSNALKASQSTVLTVYYGRTAGALIPYSNYEYSTSTTNASGRNVDPNFAVKVDAENKTVQVWYHLERRGIDYTFFPQYFSKDRAEELLARNKEKYDSGLKDVNNDPIPDIADFVEKYANATTPEEKELYKPGYEAYSKWFESYYQFVPADSTSNTKGYGYYEYKAGTFSNMSEIVLRNLYLWMYEWCGYTKADLIEDNEEFDVDFESVNPAFEIAIEYKLTDHGLEVTIPGNSIKEYEGYTLCNVDILPYFTSTKAGIEGYTIIPDGSGSVMMHDNGKSNIYSPYSKRFYTTDLSQTSFTKKALSYDIMLPMYAVVNEGSGVLVEALQMASQLELKATTSGYGNLGESNNTNYFRAYIRESQDVYIGTYAKEAVRKFTEQLIAEDIILDYTFLAPQLKEGDTLDYAYVAKKYRESLIRRYGLVENDITKTPVLDMDVIGSYTYKNNFLGIGYTDKGSMTTYEELEKMIDTYLDLGIEYINAFYYGWRKEGLVNVSFENLKLNSLLGSKKQLQALVQKNENVRLYPYMSMGELNEYQENFGKSHYNSRDVVGEIITKYPYDMSTNTYDKKAREISVLSPRYYYAFTQSLVDSYTKLFGTNSAKKNAIGLNSISIDKFGAALSGDYKKGIEMFKISAIREQLKSLELIYNSGIQNINLYAPYDYAFKYISHAKDIPYQSSQYEILDYSIPFYQLVVNGLFDYSGESINANIEDGLEYHIMKLIETGSNPQFTFTFDSSAELSKTDYNNFYNTEYTNWLKEVEILYNELNNLGIYGYQLYSHERIEANVYRVVYQNAATNEKIEIVLNYSLTSVYVDGKQIHAKSYEVL